MRSPPLIGSYGLIGDSRTAALISGDGSLDWLCVPRFDSDPLFGRLIDPVRGGYWSIDVRGEVADRRYARDATSLVTRWTGRDGELVAHEGMIADVSSRLLPRILIVRRLECIAGAIDAEMRFRPRMGLPGRPPSRSGRRNGSLFTEWGAVAASLSNDAGMAVEPGRPVAFTLRAGESVTFVLAVASREPLVFVEPAHAYSLLRETDRWWRRCANGFDYSGDRRSTVVRSLLTLRMLTYAPSGAPVAAPTTSLPAPLGSENTWDYRYAWPRDAALGVGAFLALGSADEPRSFLEWLVNASRITRPEMNVLYTLDGKPVPNERVIDGVAGYGASGPVRVGNAARSQFQLDVYGWMLDASLRMDASGYRMTGEQWRAMRAFADLLCDRWREPDNGIWERRGSRRHYVHSKLLAWVGLDRACRLAQRYPIRGGRSRRWAAERDLLAEEIRTRGVRDGVYRSSFEDRELDAALLLAPCLGFDDSPERMRATVAAIRRGLDAGGPLLFRGRGYGEGAFLPCSFWLVEALSALGRVEDAEGVFDRLCDLATPLGLYAEQIDPASKEHVGNFPQALTHAALLHSVGALTAARERRRGSPRTARVRSA